MNASKKAVLCLSALCCVCCGNSGERATEGNGFASGNLKFSNFAIMKAFDKGEGVTLTQEIWGPGVYWFNSGNCIRGE